MGLSRAASPIDPPHPFATAPRVQLFGVPVLNVTKAEAIAGFFTWIAQADRRAHAVCLVNAHTMNLACERSGFRAVLTEADAVFGDGTGVRIATRLKGERIRDNLVGTDLVPELFAASQGRGLRCYLLGGNEEAAVGAARWVEEQFPWVQVVGHRNGYVLADEAATVVAQINATAPDLLLVGMGNPLQEEWIVRHRSGLRVPVCIGVGGLFDHWAGNLRRAAPWVRRLGIEWMQILWQQPQKKWRRYMVGNPQFLWRALRDVRSK